MFSYFGSKANVIRYYPRPVHARIIEPFAGGAQYALRYWKKDILLVDKYELIVKLWRWLQSVDPDYIRALPRLECGQSVDEFDWEYEEAKWLMGFIIAVGVTEPRKVASKWTTAPIHPNRQNFKLNQIADNLYKIKHWEIVCDDYRNIPNMEATWFVDPPYQVAGDQYVHGNKAIDFPSLADWCRHRRGQVVVCENSTADWMEFVPVRKNHGARSNTTEVMWTNFETHYHYHQAELL